MKSLINSLSSVTNTENNFIHFGMESAGQDAEQVSTAPDPTALEEAATLNTAASDIDAITMNDGLNPLADALIEEGIASTNKGAVQQAANDYVNANRAQLIADFIADPKNATPTAGQTLTVFANASEMYDASGSTIRIDGNVLYEPTYKFAFVDPDAGKSYPADTRKGKATYVVRNAYDR